MTKSIDELIAVEFNYAGTEEIPAIIPTEIVFYNTQGTVQASIGLNIFVDSTRKVTMNLAEIAMSLNLPRASYKIEMVEFTTTSPIIALNYHATRGLALTEIHTPYNEFPRMQAVDIAGYLPAHEEREVWYGSSTIDIDSKIIGSTSAQFEQLVTKAISMSGQYLYIFDDGQGNHPRLVAVVEDCHEYYLRWTDRLGATRCMYFDWLPQYTEEIEKKYLVTATNAERQYALTSHGKWELTRKALSDEQYKNLESLFVAADLQLYEKSTNTWYNVKLNDNFVEKYYKREKQLLKLTLTVEELQTHKIVERL